MARNGAEFAKTCQPWMPAIGAIWRRDSHKVLLWNRVNAPRKIHANFKEGGARPNRAPVVLRVQDDKDINVGLRKRQNHCAAAIRAGQEGVEYLKIAFKSFSHILSCRNRLFLRIGNLQIIAKLFEPFIDRTWESAR
jgi:hypothetical protein